MKLWPASSSTEGSLYTIRTQEDQNILHLAAAADSADKRKAAADNRKEMVQGILKYCPKMYKDDMLKQPDSNGDTPLHLIISQGCFIPELVKYEGLDTKTRNKQGFTPMDMLYVKDAIVEDQYVVNAYLCLASIGFNFALWLVASEVPRQERLLQ
uniref:PGG domain-containing protein n=1 Tax=Daucus carota subsp. sativus TaxID=79200 RepID=A0A175YGI2_DAUCS